ncbi:glycosyltransferase [Limosilactobacillus panis]|uniref:glycosyltransferase family 2 protein n=1 Tax=Limosilactobacillus panis TaxID=47493 RepID=UPI001C96404E|nr:glycosyltransferase family 2 protein [Limosilactobacillus panis]QZN92363.1 glycosyltransferase [Limosilactobacillus panis]
MQNERFFSVILNTYNNQSSVVNTLNSVLKQSYKNFELIIVDDHSADKTLKLIKDNTIKLTIPVKIISLTRNHGVAYARNIGVENASGKFIAFIDGDDIWNKDKLEIQHNFIIKKKARWVFSNYSVINNKYKQIGKRLRETGIYNYKKIISNGNPVGMLTVVIEANILRKNPFRKVKHEDYDLWIRLSKKGILGYLISDNLAKYMKHSKSISSNKLASMKWTYGVFRINNLSMSYSLFLTIKYIVNYFRRKKYMR